MFIIGMLCLAVAGLMYLVIRLYQELSDMEDILLKMSHDLNMVSKTMENIHKHEKQKELAKQIILG
jgi:uncharacterized protein (UPF0332 family)